MPDGPDVDARLDTWAAVALPLSIFGCLSNVFLLAVARDNPDLRKNGTLLLVALAMADLCCMATTLSYTAYMQATGEHDWSEGTVKALGYLTTVTLSWSMLTLTFVAKERYRRIVQEKPVPQRWLLRHAAAALGISMVFASLPLYGAGWYERRPDSPYCMTTWVVSVNDPRSIQKLVYMSEGIGCMGWIFVAYVLMHRKVQCVMSAVGGKGKDKSSAKANMSVAWRSAMIVGFFVLLWAGYILMLFYEVFTGEYASWSVDVAMTLLSQSNSAFNPIVVMLVDKRFNRAAHRTRAKALPQRCGSSTIAVTNLSSTKATSSSNSAAPPLFRESGEFSTRFQSGEYTTRFQSGEYTTRYQSGEFSTRQSGEF